MTLAARLWTAEDMKAVIKTMNTDQKELVFVLLSRTENLLSDLANQIDKRIEDYDDDRE